MDEINGFAIIVYTHMLSTYVTVHLYDMFIVYFSPVMYHHTLQHLSHSKTVLLEVITKTTKYITRALHIIQKPSQPDTEGLSGNMQSSGIGM